MTPYLNACILASFGAALSGVAVLAQFLAERHHMEQRALEKEAA